LKAYFINPFTILAFFIFIAIGCRSTKRLQKSQALVTKLEVTGVNKEFAEQAKDYVPLDVRPNSRPNLWLYNTFSKKGKNKIGEAPHILDSSLVEIARNQIEQFLKIKGYLNAKVTDSIATKNKKASVFFFAIPGTEFKFRNTSIIVSDSTVKRIYLSNRNKFTRIDSGKRYDTDSIAYEREQIYGLMKRNGYFSFLRQYVRPTVDTNFNSGVADLKIEIINPPNGNKHEIYTLNNTLIRIQPSSGIITPEMVPDTTVVDSQYKFYDYSKFFSPKKLTNYIYLKKGEIYNISNSELTTQRFFDMNAFKSVSVDFKLSEDTVKNSLLGLIDIVPLKKKSNRLEGDYTFNSSISGLNLGVTYQNKNIFGGAELFEVKLRSGLQFDKNISGNLADRLLSRDYQVGVSLSYPRLITPFNFPLLGKNSIPRTRIATNYQIYKLTNNYSRNTLGSNLTYDWLETRFKQHSLTAVNIQYALGKVNPLLSQTLLDNGNGFFLFTLRPQLVTSSYYNYSLNLAKLNTLSNFLFFSGNAELAGTSASLISRLSNKKNSDDQRLLFGVPYSQFTKLETDIRLYRFLGKENQLIFRVNPGLGYSYNNSKTLPFDKQFFAGGSSGIRAWQARTLGPGNYNRATLANDTIRTNLRNLDQLGDIKFEGNIEYRFKIADNFFSTKVKGATFIDFGNTWLLRKNNLQQGGQFKFSQLYNQTAIGVGVGLRFDVSFFVFRLDAGFKFKDPQFSGDDQYVYKYWFNKSEKKVFKDDYAFNNNPDRYSLSQIQFGIGLPF
jgi:outer membrane protein insertion porin family